MMIVSISTKSARIGHTPTPSFGSSIIRLRNLPFSTQYFHFSAAWCDILDYILSENAEVIFLTFFY